MSDAIIAGDEQQSSESQLPAPSDISIALLYPGNRAEKVTVPMAATELEVDVEPADAYERDIILVDNPDRQLGYEVLKKSLHGAKLVYRMRGDLFHELSLWDMHPLKKWVAEQQVVPRVDGVIAVCDWMAEKMRRRAGVRPVGTAGLVKNPDNWPTVAHNTTELRAVTLTNANYKKKIQPIIEWAPEVNSYLADRGGIWRVGGEGMHEGALADDLASYNHVRFEGYLDAHDALASSNIMLHPSRLDALPNAILEGMASGLPVVTNDFRAFTDYGGPIITISSVNNLVHHLDQLRQPSARQQLGRKGITHLEAHHTAEAIGREYVRYFQELMSE